MITFRQSFPQPVGICALTLACCGVGVACAQTPLFSDQTAAAGLAGFMHSVSAADGEAGMMTGGVAAGDFDNDGWQDIFVLGGPSWPDRVYMNNRDGTFTDRAAAWGVNAVHHGVGVAVADVDGDGWLDVFVTSGGSDGTACAHKLYHNNGNGTFTDLAAVAGVQVTALSTSDGFGAGFGDYDLDGKLDLAVAGWKRPMGGNRLFHNVGNGLFADATSDLGTDMTLVAGFSPVFADMDGDRYPELLWVSDFSATRYFINNRDGTFRRSTTSGVGLEGNGMGTVVADLNGDGRPDWYVTSVYTTNHSNPAVPGTGNMLYINNGNNSFTERSTAGGVKQTGWAWGTIAADLRNIGRQDLVVTNGWQQTFWNGEFLSDPSCVFLNNGDGTFASVAAACGVTDNGLGRGLIAFDYNNDGRMDLLMSHSGGPLTLYRNDSPAPAGAGPSYLRVFLDTRGRSDLAPNGYGAHVTLTTAGPNPTTQHRWVNGGPTYLSQSELSAHFGLGGAGVAELRVEWPDGSSTVHAIVAADRTITVRACEADFNRDGLVSVQDIFDFLGGYFGADSRADTNLSGSVTIQDIFDYLSAYFRGC